MSYGLNLCWEGPIGEHIGFWGGPIKGYTTNLVQGTNETDKLARLGFHVVGRSENHLTKLLMGFG